MISNAIHGILFWWSAPSLVFGKQSSVDGPTGGTVVSSATVRWQVGTILSAPYMISQYACVAGVPPVGPTRAILPPALCFVPVRCPDSSQRSPGFPPRRSGT